MKIQAVLLWLAVSPLCAQPRERTPSIESLTWLSGCWELNAKSRVVSENWMKPSGDTMLGVSRTVRDGRTVEFEFVRLLQDSGGTIHYSARPSGQEGATFKAVRLDSTRVVFENRQHDFPQRIIYRFEPPDSLYARIEGTINGKERRVDFPYRKVKCE